MKKVLVVAYHFPPQSGSSGLLRSLKFTRYLLENGWTPSVLTVKPLAYERTENSLLKEIPEQVSVTRTFALDVQRHLSIKGRYLSFTSLPDRWVSWCLSAIPWGISIIIQKRIDVLFSTFPIASAVLIGLVLHRLSGLPWVVDLRDSMTEDEYPRDPRTRRMFRAIEAAAMRHGSLFLFTASSTIAMYLQRYPDLDPKRCILLPNGYDEEDFRFLSDLSASSSRHNGTVRLVHAGLMYPEERDPRPFFQAVSELKREGRLDAANFRVDLRAAGEEKYYAQILDEMNITDLVHLLPPLPYQQALRDAAAADGLLLFQGVTCNHQIPAKAYEYMRLRRPILALTTHEGDTAALLRDTGGATIVDMYSADAIRKALPDFIRELGSNSHPLADPEKTARYARRNQARELAGHLDELVRIGVEKLPT